MDVSVVPPALGQRLGAAASGELVGLFDAAEERCVNTVVERSIERFERRLTEEISGLRLEMVQGHAALRQEIAGEKADLLTWSFLFWIGQVVATTGIVAMLLRASGR